MSAQNDHNHADHRSLCFLLPVMACLMFVGCIDTVGFSDQSDDEYGAVYLEVAGDQVEIEVDSRAEQAFLEAGKPFVEAIIQRDYGAAYEALSRHARARMSRNQFEQPEDDAVASRREESPLVDVSRAQFISLVERCLQTHGKPKRIQSYWVQSTESETLRGEGHPLDVMFTIGGMPQTIPGSIRRASLRVAITTDFRPGTIEDLAREYEITPEEVLEDEAFAPYFSLKLVLVEDERELKVGYFEFLPPSMFD